MSRIYLFIFFHRVGARNHRKRILRTNGSSLCQFRRPVWIRSSAVGSGTTHERLPKRYEIIITCRC